MYYIAYQAINKTDHAFPLLWQTLLANDAGSRSLLSDTIMDFWTINQLRVDFFLFKVFPEDTPILLISGYFVKSSC